MKQKSAWDCSRFTLQYGNITATLTHWQGDIFLARWNLPGLLDDSLIAFQPAQKTMTIVNDHAQFRKTQ